MKFSKNLIYYCKNCLMPSSRPRIVIKNNICNACKYKDVRKNRL